MKDIDSEIDKVKKAYAKYFLLSFAGVFLFYILVYYITDYYQLQFFVVHKSFLYIGFLLCLYTYYILSKAEYNFTAVFSIIFILFFSLVTYLSLLLSTTSETIMLFYLPVISLFLFLYDYKATIFFSLIIIFLCYFMPDISNYFGFSFYNFYYINNPISLKIQEYFGICISGYAIFFNLHYYKKVVELKIANNKGQLVVEKLNNQYESKNIMTKDDAIAYIETSKFVTLFNEIIRTFNEKKPYEESNFSIRHLAEMLDSNTTYVSAALNKIGNKKFNQLVNEYRIKQVLENLEDGLHHKFTIEYIYKNAGFSQQSTFNRIFKEQTGFTPSEYIENLNNSQSLEKKE